ncbi:MAG: hypothetical protein HC921_21515 [Synechococcaceae cyanobacterium SM2_3_1]|nr:hypothetical protein [Synechococcaceae cyanobacterium SM2_3_1]
MGAGPLATKPYSLFTLPKIGLNIYAKAELELASTDSDTDLEITHPTAEGTYKGADPLTLNAQMVGTPEVVIYGGIDFTLRDGSVEEQCSTQEVTTTSLLSLVAEETDHNCCVITTLDELSEVSRDTRGSLISKHLPGGSDPHKFNDRETMERVAQEIFRSGDYSGFVRDHDRFTKRFDEPIGYREQSDGSRLLLYVGEVKVNRKRCQWHVIPRTGAA